MPEMPWIIETDQPQAPAQTTLAEVQQRQNEPAINVESQIAALRKGNATCPVCEAQSA
jgi:type VI secretion system secreted protein VgrG